MKAMGCDLMEGLEGIRNPCKLLKRWSGKPDPTRRRPAWEAGILPLNYSRLFSTATPVDHGPKTTTLTFYQATLQNTVGDAGILIVPRLVAGTERALSSWMSPLRVRSGRSHRIGDHVHFGDHGGSSPSALGEKSQRK